MKTVVFGAGFQGSACALDLSRSEAVESVLLIDQSLTALEAAQQRISSPKVSIQQGDITNLESAVAFMKQGNVAVSAVPYFFNEMLTQAAIQAGCHFVDMGGNTDLVLKQLSYAPEAKLANVTIIPDMGLAPGYANLLAAELISHFDEVSSVAVRVGGLPQNPQPPLDYQLFFSVEGLINEYIGECVILKDGKRTTVKSLTELETITFPAPLGQCEAFHTLGGSSTLPWTYEGKVKDFNYKTVRYPGHCEKLQLLEELGFFETDMIQTRDGQNVQPRQVTAALFNQKLSVKEPKDYVVVKVVVKGQKAGQWYEESFECLDAYDPQLKLTAMMRMTAFPVSIVAQLLGTNAIQERGVFPPERIVPIGVVREEMAKRGLKTTHHVAATASLVSS